MSENMRIWESVKQPPAKVLKRIPAGRLKGFTDIHPQWRIQTLTEQFGPCGFGWKYTIGRQWVEDGADGEVAAFVNISLYVKIGDEWSDAIEGVGSSKLISKEKGGLRTNEEAYKMALTDALSVCCKDLGFGADIYFGRWDGSKYAVEVDDDGSNVKEWLAKCEADSINDQANFPEWWGKNGESVKKECGEVGAVEVYKLFSMYYERLKKEAEE